MSLSITKRVFTFVYVSYLIVFQLQYQLTQKRINFSLLVHFVCAGPIRGFWCLTCCFRSTITVCLWNALLMTKICTSALLFRYFFNLWGKKFGVVPNISYKVIQHQIWSCQKFTKSNVYVFLHLRGHKI